MSMTTQGQVEHRRRQVADRPARSARALDALKLVRQQAVDQLDGRPAGGAAQRFALIGIEDVVDARPAAHRARLAAGDLAPGQGLQLQGHVLDDMAKPGAFRIRSTRPPGAL
jgi:hypothetical protein